MLYNSLLYLELTIPWAPVALIHTFLFFVRLSITSFLNKEILSIKHKSPLSTIYLGGGTPSILDPTQVKELIDLFKENYGNNVEEVNDPNWLGGTSWEANNKRFYYNKILKLKNFHLNILYITICNN